MKLHKLIYIFSLALLINIVVPPSESYAHDTDIYTNNAATTASSVPMLMFTIDNRPSTGSTKCGGYNSGDPASECYGIVPYIKDASGTPIAGPWDAMDVYKAAIAKVLYEGVILTGADIKVGLMVNHENDNSCTGQGQSGCSNGAYVMYGFNQINDTAQPDTHWNEFLVKLRTVTGRGAKYQGSEMMFEFYRYLKGGEVYNGYNGWTDAFLKQDFSTPNVMLASADINGLGLLPLILAGGGGGGGGGGGDPTFNINQAEDTGGVTGIDPVSPWTWDASIIDTTGAPGTDSYISPITSDCAKIYTINFAFGVVQQDADSNAAIAADFGISVPSAQDARYEAVLAYLYNHDFSNGSADVAQNVVSYFYVDGPTSKQHGWAQAGTGGAQSSAFDISDPDALVADLKDKLNSILSTSTTFVAPSVAVNVYNRAQVEKDVFIAMFQVEPNGSPLWWGNVKKVLLGENASSGATELQDVSGTNAVDPVNGRISQNALTYWTISGDIPAPAGGETQYTAGNDGRAVNRGGAGSIIPGFKRKCADASDVICAPGDYTPDLENASGAVTNISKRKVFTEDSTGTSLMALEATITAATDLQSDLGAATIGPDAGGDGVCDADNGGGETACNLLKFARGMTDDADGSETDGANQLSWMMADALHSRPLTINYGDNDGAGGHDADNPNVRIFVGTNDGHLRMIKNRTPGNAQDGSEGWSFMPRVVMPILSKLRTGTVHPYGVDGEVATYVKDIDRDGNIEPADGDKVYIYTGLRRGGAAYYALDVTDPDSPSLLWRIVRTVGGDFDELGESWSTPKVVNIIVDGDDVTPKAPDIMLFFGGGYDANKDNHGTHGATGGDDTKGNAIFVVDALTGDLKWKAVKAAGAPSYDAPSKTYSRADLLDSIPSTMTVVDTDGNDLVDRFYVGDTGGVLWRGDMRSTNQANWTMNPILSVGRHYAGDNDADNDRRFFYAPDYVQAKDPVTGNAYDAVVIGTGDRTEPLTSDTIDWFYVFRDNTIASSALDTFSLPLRTHAGLADVTLNCLQDGVCQSTNSGAANFVDLSNGWRMQLNCPPNNPASCGEKNLSTSFTVGNTIFMTSYIPAAGANVCGPKEGGGLVYLLNLNDGSATRDNDSDGDVDINDRIIQLNSGGIPAEVVSLGGDKVLLPDLTVDDSGVSGGFRTYWYQIDLD